MLSNLFIPERRVDRREQTHDETVVTRVPLGAVRNGRLVGGRWSRPDRFPWNQSLIGRGASALEVDDQLTLFVRY